MNSYYVYILTNKKHGVLYTGVTNDIARRLSEHRIHLAKGFTYRYNLTKLVHLEPYGNIKDAILREKQIKGWLREKKIHLIEAENPEWTDLSEDWHD